MYKKCLAILSAAAVMFVALCSTSSAASTAEVASAPRATVAATATANLCGSSYRLIDKYYKANDSSDRVDLEAALYYSASAKRNCLIVSHYGAWRGYKGSSLAMIRPHGSAWPKCNSTGCDKGEYAYYAGPVYTPAGVDMSHKCVDFAGTTAYDTYIVKSKVHCG
jgi:hypothetical protein